MDYSFMDYEPEYTSMNFGKFCDFSGKQKGFILAVNRSNNGGSLKSDDPKDYFTWLRDEAGYEDSPEVDHIYPKSKGGTNQYLNARVISRKLNNEKRAKVD